MDKIVKRQEMSENDRKKLYLKSYMFYVGQEEEILEKIQQLRMDKSCPSVTNDGMPHGSDLSDLSDYAALFDEQLQLLKQVRQKGDAVRRHILSQVRRMQDRDEQILLRLMYIKGFDITDIALVLGCKKRWAYKVYANAIEHFELKEEQYGGI